MIQKKEILKLKSALYLIILLFLIFAFNEKEKDPYTEVQFKEGLPESLKSIEKDVPFRDFRYASLDTGTDTLRVFLGTFMQGNNKGLWFGIESNGTPAHFSTLSLEEVDTLDYRTKDIEIDFNQERNRVALRVIEMDSDTYKYAWLDNLNFSKEIAVKSIEKPLRKNSQFPQMNLETLGGDNFSSNDFKDQFVVINWWATWCAPCRKEIPALNDMVEKYSDKENIRFIAITDDPKNRITSFLKNRDFKYEMTFANSEVRNIFGNSYPVNIIIDPAGKITFLKKGAGPFTPMEIEESLRQQLEMYNSGEIGKTK